MDVKLPSLVEICPLCKGEGQYRQTYNAGCGQGMFETIGRCDCCMGHRFLMKKLKREARIPTSSVINQIQIANPKFDLSRVY